MIRLDPSPSEDLAAHAVRFGGEDRNRTPRGTDDTQIVPDFIKGSRGLFHYLKPQFHPVLLAILLAIKKGMMVRSVKDCHAGQR